METKLWAMGLVVLVTFCSSFAQVFYKFGVLSGETAFPNIFFNPFVLAGLGLYVIGAGLLIISFKGGEVSVLYPIVATGYAWVVFLSAFFFEESLTVLKLAGIAFIIAGVVCIARGSKHNAVLQYEEPL